MSAADLHQMGVAQLAAAIASKHTSSVEAAQHLLARAKQHAGLGAYLTFNEDATLAQARAADARVAAGEAGVSIGEGIGLRALLWVVLTAMAVGPKVEAPAPAFGAGNKKPRIGAPVLIDYTADWLMSQPAPTGDEQWQCLKTAIYFESRGESLQGQFAVAEVSGFPDLP